MRDKIRPYVYGMFEEVKWDKDVNLETAILLKEMQEELILNLESRYDDECQSGTSPAQAYANTIECMGDIHELFTLTDENLPQVYEPACFVNPDYAGYQYSEEELKRARMEEQYNRVKASSKVLAKKTAALSFPSVVVLYLVLSLGGIINWSVSWILFLAMWGFEGLVKCLLAMRALPSSRYNEEMHQKEKKHFWSGLSDMYWSFVLCTYFIYSFATGNWGMSWLIFIIAPLLPIFIRVLFGRSDDDEEDEEEDEEDLANSISGPINMQINKVEVKGAASRIVVTDSDNGQFGAQNASVKYDHSGKATFKAGSGSCMVMIPQDYAGTVRVKSVSGSVSYAPKTPIPAASLTVSSVSGSVSAQNIVSPADVSSVSGSVRADFASVIGLSKVEAVSGSVSVSCPTQGSYLVNTHSTSGHVNSFGVGYSSSSLPAHLPEGEIRVKTVSGSIQVTKK